MFRCYVAEQEPVQYYIIMANCPLRGSSMKLTTWRLDKVAKSEREGEGIAYLTRLPYSTRTYGSYNAKQ